MGATTPPIAGNGTEGGSVSMEQLLPLLTTTILQIGGTLAHAMKNNLKSVKDFNDFTSGVKVEVPRL